MKDFKIAALIVQLEIYFEIAVEAIGETKVNELFNKKVKKRFPNRLLSEN